MQANRVATKEQEREFLGRFIRKGSLVFDIGANTGNKTETYLSIGARVVALEPQKEVVDRLVLRFADNPDVVACQMACGRSEGIVQLAQCNASTLSTCSPDWLAHVWSTQRFGKKAEWKEAVDVPCTTLDILIEKYGRPDFIKVDTEGYESEVIAGLSSAVPWLSMEWTPEFVENSIRCIDHLELFGEYKYYLSLEESCQFTADGQLAHEFRKYLTDYSADCGNVVFGDVYAQLLTQ